MEKLLKHPKVIIALTVVITVFFAYNLIFVELDNNNMKFVPEDDEARVTSAWIDDTFGSSLFILIALHREYGTIFDAEFLQKIKTFSQKIEQIETVDKVNSIMSTDYITGDSESIIVENLVPEDFSGTNEEIAVLKQRLLSWNMYERSLFNDNFTATQIYVPLTITYEKAGDPEVVASFLKIRDMAREEFKDMAVVYVSGMPVISGTINESMIADLTYLIPIVVIVILLIVYIPLKRFSFVLLSLLAVFIASVWSIGAMPIFNIRLTVISTVLPVVLIAVGNSYGLHVIIHYLEDCPKDFRSMSKNEHTEFVIEMMKVVRTPIFLAAITTFVSFLSFCVTKVTPIRDFGIFSAFGVFVSFILAIFLTPSILILRGPKSVKKIVKNKSLQKEIAVNDNDSFNDKISNALVSLSQKKGTVFFIMFLIIVISIFGAGKLVTDNIFVEYFKGTTDIAKSDAFIRREFGGSKIISIVAQADTPEILLHPDSLTVIDNLNTYIVQNIPIVGKVMGFTDLVKRTNQIFNIDESADGIKTNTFDTFDTDDGDFGFGFSNDDSFEFSTVKTNAENEKVLSTVSAELPFTSTAFAELIEKAAGSKKNMSANELVTEVKKLMNYQGASYYEIPANPARYGKQNKDDLQRLTSNYLALLSGNIDKYANDPLEPTAIKSTVQMRALGQIDSDHVVDIIKSFVKANFPGNVKVTIGGVSLVEASVNNRVVQSVWTSVIIAFISLFFIVTAVNRSFAAGLIGVLPLLFLVLVNFAVMGFLGIKLNIATAMISSLTMGIGIDYTIHFFEAYKREVFLNDGKEVFLFKAYRTSGIAIITDAVSTAAGFAVLIFSQFVMLADFGLLIALSLILSAIVGLILIPVIFNTFRPKFIFK